MHKSLLKIGIAAVFVLMLVCCGAAAAADGNYKVEDVYYDTLSEAYSNATNGATITVEAEVTEPSQVTMDGTKSVTLNLNGKTITAGNGGFTEGLIKWESTGKLTITDENAGMGSLKGSTDARVLYIAAGEVVLEEGTITDGNADNGGGVYVNSGTFTMKDGNIVGNKATGNSGGFGGGVYVKGGTFNMEGGSITGNTAEKNVNSGGSGGGVDVNTNGNFTMSGGSIIENTADSSGGGVRVNQSKFTMMGDAGITGNTAETGGGVQVGGTPSEFTIQDNASITGNNATTGGGVLFNGDTFKVKGAPEISGNKNVDADNNVFLFPNKYITVIDNFSGEIHINNPSPTSTPTPVQIGTRDSDSITGAENFISDKVDDNGNPYVGVWGTEPENKSNLFWSKQYEITIPSSDHGTVTASSSFAAKDTTITLTATPATVEYQLKELKAYKTDEPTIEVPITNNKFTMPEYDVTVEAVFEPIPPAPSHSSSRDQGSSVWLKAEMHTVTFVMNGHGVQIPSQSVSSVSTAVEPVPAPSEEGYIFEGWYTDAGLTAEYDFSTYVTSDIYLYAKWTEMPKASPVKPVQTPASPAPLAAVLAGLGAAGVFFGVRRK